MGNTGQSHLYGVLMAMSGPCIVAIDHWSNCTYFAQVNGMVGLSKIALVLVLWEQLRLPLLLFLIAYFLALSPAASRIRHRGVL